MTANTANITFQPTNCFVCNEPIYPHQTAYQVHPDNVNEACKLYSLEAVSQPQYMHLSKVCEINHHLKYFGSPDLDKCIDMSQPSTFSSNQIEFIPEGSRLSSLFSQMDVQPSLILCAIGSCFENNSLGLKQVRAAVHHLQFEHGFNEIKAQEARHKYGLTISGYENGNFYMTAGSVPITSEYYVPKVNRLNSYLNTLFELDPDIVIKCRIGSCRNAGPQLKDGWVRSKGALSSRPNMMQHLSKQHGYLGGVTGESCSTLKSKFGFEFSIPDHNNVVTLSASKVT